MPFALTATGLRAADLSFESCATCVFDSVAGVARVRCAAFVLDATCFDFAIGPAAPRSMLAIRGAAFTVVAVAVRTAL